MCIFIFWHYYSDQNVHSYEYYYDYVKIYQLPNFLLTLHFKYSFCLHKHHILLTIIMAQ